MDFLVALAVALVATPVAAWGARRLGVVDRPGPLKVHREPVPYLGGLAVFVALAAVLATTRPLLILPCALALLLGLADDLADLSPGIRLGCQALVGLVAGIVAPAPGPAVLGVALTAVATIGLVNAVNLLDGLDGLASGVVAVSALGLAALGGDVRPIALGLAGALVGFLAFNRPPARIYLGDGGSYLLGASLALLGAIALDGDDRLAVWLAVPFLVAVPVIDTAVAILRRARARRPLFGGDRSHVYDQLVDRGWGTGGAVLACVAAQAVLAAAAVGIAALEGAWPVVAASALALLVVAVVALGGFLSPTTPKGAS